MANPAEICKAHAICPPDEWPAESFGDLPALLPRARPTVAA